MSEPVHFLLHVPKCAGTTIEAHFQTTLGTGYLLAPRWDNVLRDVVGNRYPTLAGQSLDHVRVVSGHSLSSGLRKHLPGRPVLESVLIRDPVSFFRSLYGYRHVRQARDGGRVPAPFEQWYATQRRNPVSRFLLSRYFEQGVPAIYRLSSAARLAFLEERLAHFHFVGSWRHANELIAGISETLSVPGTVAAQNVTPRRGDDPITPQLSKRILTENALDQALFERWKDRRWSGAPTAPPPPLPRTDQIGVLGRELVTSIAKKLTR